MRLLITLLIFNLFLGTANAKSSVEKHIDDVSDYLQKDVDTVLENGNFQEFANKYKLKDPVLEARLRNVGLALGFHLNADAFIDFCKFTGKTPYDLIEKIKSYDVEKKVKPYYFESFKQKDIPYSEIEYFYSATKKNIFLIDLKYMKYNFMELKKEMPKLTEELYCSKFNEIADEYVRLEINEMRKNNFEVYKQFFIKK